MQVSDANNVYLSSSSLGADLAIWRLSDMVGGEYSSHLLSKPWHYEGEIFSSPVKAIAWSPNHEGVLATGGAAGD